MSDFKMRLLKEVESLGSSFPMMRNGGKSGLRLREMTTSWLDETRLSIPQFSVTVKPSEKREA